MIPKSTSRSLKIFFWSSPSPRKRVETRLGKRNDDFHSPKRGHIWRKRQWFGESHDRRARRCTLASRSTRPRSRAAARASSCTHEPGPTSPRLSRAGSRGWASCCSWRRQWRGDGPAGPLLRSTPDQPCCKRRGTEGRRGSRKWRLSVRRRCSLPGREPGESKKKIQKIIITQPRGELHSWKENWGSILSQNGPTRKSDILRIDNPSKKARWMTTNLSVEDFVFMQNHLNKLLVDFGQWASCVERKSSGFFRL